MTHEEENDSIILEHSPLYDYLKQSGVTTTPEDVTVLCRSQTEAKVSDAGFDGVSVGWFLKADDGVKRSRGVFQRIYDWFLLRDLCSLRLYYVARIQALALKSNLITEDDFPLLHSHAEFMKASGLEISRNYSHSIRLCSVIFVIFAYIIARASSLTELDTSAQGWFPKFLLDLTGATLKKASLVLSSCWWIPVVDVTLVAVGIAHISHFCRFINVQARHRGCLECMWKFVRLHEDLLMEIRSTLKLLREREILARGYTMISKYTPVVQKNTNVDEEIPKLDQPLRQKLYHAAKELFMVLRHQTQQLLNERPNVAVEDSCTPFYLSLVDLSQFGDLVIVEGVNDTRQPPTSLAALTAISQLFHLQLSECICQLCIGIDPTAVDNAGPVCVTGQDRLMRDLPRVLLSISEVAARHLRGIQWNQLHQRAQFTSMEDKSSTNNERKASEPKTFSTSIHLKSVLRSLRLHLELALESYDSLEAGLPGSDIADLSHQRGVSSPEYEDVEKRLSDISIQLKGALSCLNEAMTQITRATSEETGVLDGPLLQGLGFQNGNDNNIDITVISEDFTPSVKDQVFEAYIESAAPQSLSHYDDIDFECQKQKQQDAKHLLNELKSILSVRSKEMTRRELLAIAEQRGVSIEEVVAEANMDKVTADMNSHDDAAELHCLKADTAHEESRFSTGDHDDDDDYDIVSEGLGECPIGSSNKCRMLGESLDSGGRSFLGELGLALSSRCNEFNRKSDCFEDDTESSLMD